MLSGKQEVAVPFYRVWSIDDDAEAYWVLASSDNEARRLVALNVKAASNARDPAMFGFKSDERKTPSDYLIYRRLNGPIPIKER